ncbi:hypothetical protein D043_1429B, partial [Vibrio parahaemolyticus EKP-021]
FLGCRQPEYR